MHYVVKRLGFALPRGVVPLFLIAVVVVAIAYWVGPFRARPAELRLVALSSDGRFNDEVGIPTGWAKQLGPASEATARVPLILAVHNAGVRGAQPTELALSLPSRFRVTDGEGVPLLSQSTIGNPLVRYELPIKMPEIEPGHLPTMIGGADTLWLEPVVPTMYCTTFTDSVPEFVSAPAQDPELLAHVRMFYSFTGPRIRQRQTGLLTIQVDPELVKRAPAPMPPVFPTQVVVPEAPKPAMSALSYAGSRSTWCGDPGQPMEIFDAMWETPEGGRFFVLYHGGVPRKYLFDLNRDSVIELEMWDHDGDGKFESRRLARMPIPAFLMPYPKSTMTAADSLLASLDTVRITPEWLQLFHDTSAGALRFSTPRTRPAQPAPGAARPPVTAPQGATPETPEFVELFNNTQAGPLRFYRAQRGEMIRPESKPPVSGQQEGTQGRRPAPQREGPRLLGVPADTMRRDTLRR